MLSREVPPYHSCERSLRGQGEGLNVIVVVLSVVRAMRCARLRAQIAILPVRHRERGTHITVKSSIDIVAYQLRHDTALARLPA
jgi:hypothetical protein